MAQEYWQQLTYEALAKGPALFERGDHPAAIRVYTTALDQLAQSDVPPAARNELEAKLYVQRAHSRFIERDLPAALTDYEQALERDASLAEAHAYRGLIHYQTGRTMQAVADFDAAVVLYAQLDLSDHAARRSLAETLLNRGNAHYQRRDYAAANHDYTEALALAPDLLDALVFRGVARFQHNDAVGALADYTALLAHPDASGVQRAQVLFNRGLLRRHAGDLAGAIDDYSAALAIQPRDADCLFNRGSARAERGDLHGAVADYEGALKLNPTLEDGFNTCGMARLVLGDWAGAVRDFDRAIKQNPQAANVHANRGAAHLQAGDYNSAIADFSAELALRAPGLKGRVEAREKRAEVLNNRGLAYHYSGQFASARADYDQAIAQLRLSGGAEQIGARLASVLLNRSLLQRDMLQHAAVEQRAALLRCAISDLAHALDLAADEQFAARIRQQQHELALLEADGLL
jgi:tetratricopeptide (TPR) repeat protein